MAEPAQIAFAAACAQRLFPAYDAFLRSTGRRDDVLVRQVLDAAWDGARTGSVLIHDPAALVERCVALIPEADADDMIQAHAEDAIASAAYALQAAARLDRRAAGWAAQRVMDCLDNFLLSNQIDHRAADSDQRVWEHPLVTTEIARRDADLLELWEATNWESAVAGVRSRARAGSALPLDQLDHDSSVPY